MVQARIIIRPARPDDLAACLTLDHSLQTDSVWQMQMREENDKLTITFHTLRLPRPIRVEYPRDKDELTADLQSLNGVLVAIAEDTLLGYAHTSIMSADKSGWLRNLVVDTPYRNHRIASALLQQSKKWAIQNGANHLTLETTTRSYPAIRFMQGRGFIFCGFNDRYYTSQDITVFFGQNL